MNTVLDKNNWQCPYCGIFQILQYGENLKTTEECNLTSMSKYNEISVRLFSISCLNCKELTLNIDLEKKIYPKPNLYRKGIMDFDSGPYFKNLKSWSLMPDSRAKPQPDYLPKNVIENYNEACKIADSSPRASAILSRRCLEVMIKDFCKVEGSGTLFEKIEEVRKKSIEIQEITEESIDAIDHIRKQGNIAAHIQKPTNLLIDNVSKKDSDLLIELLEMLFQEWYIARYRRKERLAKITKAKEKTNSFATKEQKNKEGSIHSNISKLNT